MKDLQDYLERWFRERHVKKHIAKTLAVREEIASLSTVLQTREKIRFYYHSDLLETARLQGKLAALKVRLAHLDAIARKVETPA